MQSLSQEQKRAVESDEPRIFLNSGPGSGKTRVVVERIRYLLKGGAAPRSILCLTFTNKAAKVMVKRLGNPDVRAGTFHSIGAKELRMKNPNFTIYDEDDCVKMLKPLKLDELFKVILKDKKDNSPNFKKRETHEYQRLLRDNNALDFEDLIIKPFREIPESVNRRWKYIFLDEAQDISQNQMRLFLRLIGEDTNVFVVGDMDQLIYSWRDADISNMTNLIKVLNLRKYDLGDNYRCPRVVVEASERLIKNNKERMPKRLHSVGNKQGEMQVVECGTSFDEAKEIAKVAEQGNLDEFAVLYRSNWMSSTIETVFQENNIPYYIKDDINFYNRAEIKDSLAYLRLIINSKDKIALMRAVRNPRRGIGKKTMTKIKDWKKMLDLLSEKQYNKGISFIKVLENVEKNYKNDSCSALDYIYSSTNYLGYDDEIRINNMKQLKTLAKDKSVDSLVIDSALASEVEEEQKKVCLMTLHSSKGTEFKRVAIVGCEESICPHRNSIDNVEEERRLMYVGMTRAEEKLLLSHCEKRFMFGKSEYMRRSRFINEIE